MQDLPLCPTCEQPGLHGTDYDQCIAALQRAIASWRTAPSAQTDTAAPIQPPAAPIIRAPRRMRRLLITLDAAALVLGVSKRTIYHWLQAGKIEAHRTPGGTLRIYEDDLILGGRPTEGLQDRDAPSAA